MWISSHTHGRWKSGSWIFPAWISRRTSARKGSWESKVLLIAGMGYSVRKRDGAEEVVAAGTELPNSMTGFGSASLSGMSW